MFSKLRCYFSNKVNSYNLGRKSAWKSFYRKIKETRKLYDTELKKIKKHYQDQLTSVENREKKTSESLKILKEETESLNVILQQEKNLWEERNGELSRLFHSMGCILKERKIHEDEIIIAGSALKDQKSELDKLYAQFQNIRKKALPK